MENNHRTTAGKVVIHCLDNSQLNSKGPPQRLLIMMVHRVFNNASTPPVESRNPHRTERTQLDR